jgi:Fe-S-cluster-containing dehydrogenase component
MKVFIQDVSKCQGCYGCQIAYKDEHCGNDWSPYAKPQPETGQFWRKITEVVRGTRPKMKVSYIALMCMHCDSAPCMEACLNGAIYKRDDGLVIIDPNKCSGRKLCIDACPYGVIYFNQNLKIAQKCTGCAHLLDRGWPIKEPRCADACTISALRFGDESNFSTEIANGERLPPNSGDTPKSRVYYLNLPKKFIAGTVYDPDTGK